MSVGIARGPKKPYYSDIETHLPGGERSHEHVAATVVFRYSGIYNRQIKQWEGNPEWYPERRSLDDYLAAIRTLWEQRGSTVLSLIEQRLGIPWEAREHTCYVVGIRKSFSDPLTLGYHADPENGFDVLTHEMIHRYVIQRNRHVVNSPGWLALMAQYAHESSLTKAHIPIHAIHDHIYRKMNRAYRQRTEVTNVTRPDYKRSWEIVASRGAEQIVDVGANAP